MPGIQWQFQSSKHQIPISFYVSHLNYTEGKVDQRCEIKPLIECSSMSVLKWNQNSSVNGVVRKVSYRADLILLTAWGALIFSRIIGSCWAKQTNGAFAPVPKKEPNEIHIQKKYESIPPPSSPQLLAYLLNLCLPSFSVLNPCLWFMARSIGIFIIKWTWHSTSSLRRNVGGCGTNFTLTRHS